MFSTQTPLSEAELRQVNTRIRLSPREQLAMRSAFVETLPAGAEVYLYGSRTDRSAAGGDIDLLIYIGGLDFSAELNLSAGLSAKLEHALGERRIDLHFTNTLGPQAKPFAQLVLARAVRLFP